MFGVRSGEDWNDPGVWRESNPSVGVTFRADELARAYHKATKSPRAEHNFRVLRLNDWEAGHAERWISETAWRSCGESGKEAELLKLCHKGEATAVVGCDLSKTTDLSATIVLVRHGDEYHICSPRFFVPEELVEEHQKRHGQNYRLHAMRGNCELTPGNVVDELAIRESIQRDCERWNTTKVAYDPWGMEAMRQQMEAEGLECVSVSSAWGTIGPASCLFEQLVLGGKIGHPNHPILDWNLANCRTKDSPLGDWVRPVKPGRGSGMKIDGVMATIHALALSASETQATSFCIF